MEAFEAPGIWWASGSSPENGTAGILRFRQHEGLRLKLFGTLRSGTMRTFGGMPSSHQEPRIFGISESGKLMTLTDSFLASARVSIPGYEHEEYHSQILYRGAHVGEEEPRFSRLEVSLTHLTDWVGESGFRAERISAPRGGLAQYNVSYEFPPDLAAQTALGQIWITYTFHHAGDHRSEVRLGQRAWFRIEPATPITFDDALLRFVSPLEMLVALGTGKPNRMLDLNVYLDVPESEAEAAEHGQRAAVEIVFDEPGPRSAERPRAPEVLFTLEAVQDSFAAAVDRWLGFVEAYRRITNVFFTSYYERESFVDQRFLNLARSVEAYHRQRFGRSDRPAEDHEARVRAIVESAPAEHREWLDERLEHSDETTFRRRVKGLIREHDAVMAPLIGTRSQAREAFVSRVSAARNQLTHLSAEGGLPEPPRGLFELNEALGTLLQAAFISELGIPPERSVQLFNDCQRYVSAVRRAQR